MIMKDIGFELIYPDGCKEIHDGLKLDELKRRLTDLMKSLETMTDDRQTNIDSLLNIADSSANCTSSFKLEGLLLHLTSEMFIDHEDVDVQLRAAVCICCIIKLYCPDNPFLSYADSKILMKTVLIFLSKCLNEMSKLKSKADKNFLNLHKIFSICCHTTLFRWITAAEDGEAILLECVRTFFNIVRKFPDWSDDSQPMKLLCDSLVSLLNPHDVVISEQLMSFLLNFLADRCATKEQKNLSLEIIQRCMNKFEDQIQSILQSYLIRSEMEDDLSESSDNEEVEEVDDDFCSMPEYKIARGRTEQKLEKSKQKAQKLEKKKNTIETCVEYSCDHTFQLIYELFKISQSIVTPLLSTIEMKLRSPNNVTDRKRACRLLGKLFVTYIPNNNNDQSSLWECFLGRFCDIEVEVREICLRVARDVLKRSLSGEDTSGILSIPTSKEDLVKALQKRSHDQEESIRYQLVLSISQIFESSTSIVRDEELDFVNDMLFKILLDRTRDKCMIVRKEANASLGKLYRRILTESESRSSNNDTVDLIIGPGNLLPGQKIRLELLLTQILRLYLRVEVEDRIVVERLFNTYLVPYNFDSPNRMKALIQCFTICSDSSLKSIQELFKTQVMIMNILRETVYIIRDSNSEKVLSPSVGQKLKEKVKRLTEFLPNKDKSESLTKLFVLIRSDKKLYEIMSKLVNPESQRDVIVKSISEIKRHFSAPLTKLGADANPAHIMKKKAFISTIKCLLERSAPIIMDHVSGGELISLLVSSKEALESSNNIQDYTISISRALNLIHVISITYRNSIPIHDAYQYIVSIISRFDDSKLETPFEMLPQVEVLDDKQSTPSSSKSLNSLTSPASTTINAPKTIEQLCLLTLAKIIGSCSPTENLVDNEEEKLSVCHEHTKSAGLFSDDTDQTDTTAQTIKVIQYLIRCATEGSTQPLVFSTAKSPVKHKNKDRRGMMVQPDDGDREQCLWKYNTRIAKLASRCLIGLYYCCQQELRGDTSVQSTQILGILEAQLDDLVKNCGQCEIFSTKQSIVLSTLSQLGLHLRKKYGADIHSYVQDTVLMRILTDEPEVSVANDQAEVTSRNLSLWTNNCMVPITTQTKLQALKMLSKWMVTLKVDEDRNIILSVMVCLRKFIGSYSNVHFTGHMTDGDMAQMRLAAGKCWLGLAQVQSFLSIFDAKWLHRLAGLIYDPCPQVRDGFLRKLHKGLFRLQLPLDYMAMFAFVPLIQSSDYLTVAKNYFSANVTRRREFLERNPNYLTDAKLLFAVLPEYVLAFIIHMLAHDSNWTNYDDQPSILRVKQCLWFVMEPILKLNENSSFIRKLLEKIKHAQDATEPCNGDINEKLYICCDIALGLLISKQASYDLKEYPVELKLPRTRYVPAPNTFFNPDFANILLENGTRALVQFSPTHKSKQMIMNFMPAPLIKGHTVAIECAGTTATTDDPDFQATTKITFSSKPKKHVAKIVVGFPEIESEGVSGQTSVAVPDAASGDGPGNKKHGGGNVRRAATKRKNVRTESPTFPDKMVEELCTSPTTSVTKRGRICKPNVRVMKDMVGLSRKSAMPAAVVKTTDTDPVVQEIATSSVRLEGTVSVNLERIDNIESTVNRSAMYDYDSVASGDDSTGARPITKSPRNKTSTFTSTSKGPVGKKNKNKLPSPPVKKPTKPRHIVTKEAAKHIRRTTSKTSNKKDNQESHRKLTATVTQTTPNINQSNRGTPSPRSTRTTRENVQSSIHKPVPEKASLNAPKAPESPSKSLGETPSTGRTTRSSQDTTVSSYNSAILSQLTKHVVTRKASSIRSIKNGSKTKFSSHDQSTDLFSVLETDKTPVRSSTKRTSVNGTGLVTPTNTKNAKQSTEVTPKVPVEIIHRSKRLASQAATDQLVKNLKIV